MGSGMKKSIFDEQTSKALKKWHMAVKKRQGTQGGKSPTRMFGRSRSRSPSPSTVQSSSNRLRRFKTTGHSVRSYDRDDNGLSDYDGDTLSPTSATKNLISKVDREEQVIQVNDSVHGDKASDTAEFSFVKTAPTKEP